MGKFFNTSVFALITGLGVAANSMAIESAHDSLSVPKLEGDIAVDGNLDEAVWQQATEVELSYVTRPYENTRPPVTTTARIFEDGEVLYVAFQAQDPNPDEIRARFRDRDRIWSDDTIGIKLDTFGDSRLAYQFFVNPYGVQSDAIENQMTGRESSSWDTIWHSAGRVTESGYQVEMAIPLQGLNFSDAEGVKRWGAEFVRFYPRDEHLRISNLTHDRDNACNLCQMGPLEGFADAQQGSNLAVVPTLVLGKGRQRDPSVTEDWDYYDNQELGLDVNWGITPEISLQATLNPDFSQVESDAAQLSINNTFALFFDEKRPFFLANADYFSTNFNLVYTRNIASPDYGVKVTGRQDQHTFGLFVADDEDTTFLVPGNLGSNIAQLGSESNNMALRYRYDISDDLSVGFISTARTADDYHNYVYGLDSKYQITPSDTLRVQVVRSDTQYPQALFEDYCNNDCQQPEDYSEAALRVKQDDSFSGSAWRINYNHNERNWNLWANHNAVQSDFRSDLGFESRVDRTTSVLGGGYTWHNENSWWHNLHIAGDWDITHNDAGELIEKEKEVHLHLHATRDTYFQLRYIHRRAVGLRQDTSTLAIDDNAELFTERFVQSVLATRPSKDVAFSVFMRKGSQIDYANNRLGRVVNLGPRVKWDIGEHLQFQVRHTYQDFDAEGDDLFTANLTDARLTWQFDQRQFLRFVAIYSDIDRNPANYADEVDDHSASLGTQLLYSYKINPLTKFFIGYSDSAYEVDHISRLKKDNQSIFMKFSYAWLN